MRAHWVPYRCSTKLCPTVTHSAQTLVEESAVTSSREVIPAFGFAPGASFHDEPSQCSIRGHIHSPRQMQPPHSRRPRWPLRNNGTINNDRPSNRHNKSCNMQQEKLKSFQVTCCPGEKPRKLSLSNDLRSCFTRYRVFSFCYSSEARHAIEALTDASRFLQAFGTPREDPAKSAQVPSDPAARDAVHWADFPASKPFVIQQPPCA
jgi:hypothetical protein